MRKNRKDQGIDDMVSNLGFAIELLKVIARAIRAKGGNMNYLRRIVKGPAFQQTIAEIVVSAGSEIERPLGENEYLVHVAYDMPRDKATLEAEFSKDGVSPPFYEDYSWESHSSCADADQTPGNRVMLLKRFVRNTKSEVNIAKMNKLGYRPATHLEAYAFAKANPDLQRQSWIVALGSFIMYDGHRVVAVLCGHSGRRLLLYRRWFAHGWKPANRFLFVRK